MTDTITLDLTAPPAPTITSPAAGETFAVNSPQFTGSAEPYATVELVDANWQTITTTPVDSAGNWSTPVGPLSDGQNRVRAFAIDRADNKNSSNYTQTYVTIDTTPPGVPVIDSPTDGFSTEDTVLTISGTEPRESLDIAYDRYSTITLYDGTTELGSASARPFQQETSRWSIDTGQLNSGSHNFTVTATDHLGNVSSPSANVQVMIEGPDTIPPVVTPPADIELDAESSIGNSTNQPEIAAFLNGASAVDNVDGSLPVNNNATYLVGLGDNTITFTATDSAGNVGTATAVITITDMSPPVVYPPADTTVTARSVDGIELGYVSYIFNQARATDKVDGSFTISNGKLSHDAPAFLPIGVTVITFTATDAAGHTGTGSFNLTVAHPQVTPLAGPNGAITPDSVQEVPYGTSASFTVTPDPGYTAFEIIDTSYYDGSCGGTLIGNTYTTLPVAKDCKVDMSFRQVHLVTVSPASPKDLFSLGGHGMAVKSDRSLVGWGNDSYGETSPPPDLGPVVDVDAGFYFTVALKQDGTVAVWGNTDSGQGDIPEGLSDVVAVSAGNSHILALKQDGTVVGWGSDNFGEASPPPGLKDVIAIDAGYSHSLALLSNGTVVAWGRNIYGETAVPGTLTGVTEIAAGFQFSAALKEDGTVTAWGHSQYRTVPSGLSNVIQISAGLRQAVALQADGSVVTWGLGATQTDISDAISVAGGMNSFLALRQDGSLVGWGANDFNEISGIPASLSLTPYRGVNGTVSPSTTQVVEHGETLHIQLNPSVGHSVSVGGSCGGILEGTEFISSPIVENCSIEASFYPPLPGDLNMDGSVDLADVILSLKILAGESPADTVHISGDIDGNMRIDFTETITILRDQSL